MDQTFVRGLREAKALLDEGVFSQGDYESEKARLLKQREEREAAEQRMEEPEVDGMEPCLQGSTLESAAQVPMADQCNKVEVDCTTQLGHVLAGMAGLFRDGLLCDVTVIVGATEFKAHACLLAAVSGYFRGLLIGASPIQKAATKIPLTFEHVTAAAFAAVLDCIYTGKMVVEEDRIVAVVHISNNLELLAVRTACIGHLVSRVQDSNMEQMLALGQELACTELVDAAKAAIRKRSGYGSPNGDDKEEEDQDKPIMSTPSSELDASCKQGDIVATLHALPFKKRKAPCLDGVPAKPDKPIMSTPSSELDASCKQGKGGVSHSSSSSMSPSSVMPGSSKSTSSCSGEHSPAKKSKTQDEETHHGTQHVSTLSITKEKPEHEQHNLLEALVPVNLELPSQRNSMLESDHGTQQVSTLSITKEKPEHEQHNLLEALVPVNLELTSQRNSMLESDGTQHVSTLSITKENPEHEQHNLLEALVPVNLELTSQRNSMLESDGTQHVSTLSITKENPEHEQHNLLEALVPVNLELTSQRNSMLESDESTPPPTPPTPPPPHQSREGEALVPVHLSKGFTNCQSRLELLWLKGQGEALVGQNLLSLVHVSWYLTGLNKRLLEGVPRNARDSLDLAGKLPLALKANAIGIPPHELDIDPANGGLLGKADAIIRGAGGVGAAGGADRQMSVEIKGTRTYRGHKTFQLSRLRPSSCFEHLILVVRSRNPTDWTDVLQLDELFWMGYVPRAAFDRALAARFGASVPDDVKAHVTIDSRRESWLGPHIQWIQFKDLTRSWWNTNVRGVMSE